MKKKFKIFANYGVLGAEKRIVYSCITPCSDIYDEIFVQLPENDSFTLYENYIGDLMVEATWGDSYTIHDVLNDLHDRPLFSALENANKLHRVYLKSQRTKTNEKIWVTWEPDQEK